MLTTAEIASAFSVGVHGTTYGGNPLACAVAGAVFDVINTTEVLDGVKARHALFMEGLKAINARRRVFSDLRGEGVWIGCELDAPWKGKAMDVLNAAGECRPAGARRRAGRRAHRAVAGDQPRRDSRGPDAPRDGAQSRADLAALTPSAAGRRRPTRSPGQLARHRRQLAMPPHRRPESTRRRPTQQRAPARRSSAASRAAR